ncbi:chemotaxis protein CheA [Treponema sp. OMZ 840]|uniref:chemotaxis protein CheW n=1 Tax=Treponema sp. OMZ 840 TaxID=244313 RepID=UPI003D91051F
MSDYLDINNEELLKDFFSEAEQQVENLESNILVIENDPTNHEAIDEIFRAAHTLKGGSATVEMTELSTFTHAVEDVLDELRSDTIPVTEEVVDVLLSSIDVIKAMLEARANGSIYEEDVEPLKSKLHSFAQSAGSKKDKASSKTAAKAAAKAAAAQFMPTASSSPAAGESAASGGIPDELPSPASYLSEYDLLELKQICASGEKLWGVTVVFDEANPMNSVGGIQVFAALKEKGSVLKTIPDFEDLYEDTFHPQVVYYISSALTGDDIEDAAFLDDVVLAVDAQNLDNASAPSKPASLPQKEEAPAQSESGETEQNAASEPVAVAAPAAEIKTAVSAPKSAGKESSAESSSDESKPAAASAAAKKAAAGASSHASSSGSVLRVDSKRIDYLLNLVSETVIAKAAFNQTAIQVNELQSELQGIEASYKDQVRTLFDQIPNYLENIQNGKNIKDIKAMLTQDFGSLYTMFDTFDSKFKGFAGKFRSYTQNLGRIAGELQEGVMKIRMVPISQIFSRFPRVVRDLSRDLDKKIDLIIEGEDTELDKSVVEDLLDPIMHCVRNSLDHGIEAPDVRAAAGKNETGTVHLRARNEGNMIVIEIEDDGKGIDVNAVRTKAVERGLIHPDKIITDQEAFQFIFDAGFSTSKTISSVSGRGVGLDVVKTQIEKLNGTVIVTSEHGKGTMFSIKLPLTLAIIQGLLVRVGNEVYSIPIASVIESQRIKTSEINRIDNYEVLSVRNEVISVLRLGRLFGIRNTQEADMAFIVIVGTADKKLGIMVDSLIGEEDIVIKPLKDQFASSPGIAGASILGDGSVSLIIDVGQLLELGVKQELSAREKKTVQADRL